MNNFEEQFLGHYLKLGLGSMPKSDIDALVMFLLDQRGGADFKPMAGLSNQVVSERLKTPVSKVKRLRYEAALKYGGRAEDEAMGRLLGALTRATLDIEAGKICLIIEDALAKNWLQGQLKTHQQIFDHSFNSEIVKVDAQGLFDVLDSCFDKAALAAFRKTYEQIKTEQDKAKLKKAFKDAANKFAEGAAKAAGASVVTILKAHLLGV